MDCDCGEIPANRVRLLSFARARQTVSESVSALQAGCLSSSFWTRLQRHMSSRTLLLLLERARRPSASVLGRDYLLVISAVSCLHSCVPVAAASRASRESPGRVRSGGYRRWYGSALPRLVWEEEERRRSGAVGSAFLSPGSVVAVQSVRAVAGRCQ